jgi:4-amino-4-deoxy-L-arabinose transferase-like glycosyltransferase
MMVCGGNRRKAACDRPGAPAVEVGEREATTEVDRQTADVAPGRSADARCRGSLLVALTLAAALLLGCYLRIDTIQHKHGLHVDEAWDYVTATGHLAALETGIGTPRGQWTTAARWQALWHPQAVWDFRQISLDLARFDVHPALYFWLLHVWVLLFGVTFWSGPLLNLFIDIATGAALFFLARRLLRDPLAAALVVLAWSVSPPVRLTSSMARMYPLLALFAVLFVWALLAAIDRRAPTQRPVLARTALALATAGGLLTQYQFALIIVGGALLALIVLARGAARRLLGVLSALAIGLLITLAVQPGVYEQFRREQIKGRAQHFTPGAFVTKVDGAAGCVFGFFGLAKPWFEDAIGRLVRLDGLMPGHRLSVFALLGFWLVVAALIVGLGALFVPAFRCWIWRHDRTGWLALVLLAWIAGTIIAQNLAFLSQPKVLSPRYLAVAFPFFAFVPFLIARFVTPRYAHAIVALFCLVVVATLTWGPTNYAPGLGAFKDLRTARRVLVDTTTPYELPTILWDVPASAQVDVAPPGELRDDPGPWIGVLGPGDFYVHRANGQPCPLPLLLARHKLLLMGRPQRKITVYRLR